ncbi:hypothetical protein BU25DRAFT_63171 [Macroventuria anomochaeta]|uniref:Uncharacterized protein n=1 Tax=Macroventuria anomochaeta TaxID=301207 RepID=A0ACB6S052_9PLEO|nr:uncharacterized protein BU25DRAFT_63171 [Macroventuria anomochaeta]KAF2627409.1 hypothetical protein BU25DRAFT_63171 [Macroventuria anomochaeta]
MKACVSCVLLTCYVSIDAATREAVSAPMHPNAGNVRTTTATGKSSSRFLTAFSLCCATSGRRVETAVESMWYGATMLKSGREGKTIGPWAATGNRVQL